ncbi:hypothetical protein HMPREF0490_00849 [Lachnospiraceae bacterium 6_1_37FAA]|nr:hypothetical protein HMPREF0490_00849 [Lachnospiraceae bacterium 6_1_37FAA]
MQYVLDSTNEQIQSHIQFISDGAVSIRHNPLLEAFFKKMNLMIRKMRKNSLDI